MSLSLNTNLYFVVIISDSVQYIVLGNVYEILGLAVKELATHLSTNLYFVIIITESVQYIVVGNVYEILGLAVKELATQNTNQ